jgi:N-acetylglucosaminyldiphosphoundecaprenol N-acetyl-beta-D-mannosaminyltransferase
MQRYGLDWLFRALQEPERLWKRYLTTNSRFVGMVTRAKLRQLLTGTPLVRPGRVAAFRQQAVPARPVNADPK